MDAVIQTVKDLGKIVRQARKVQKLSQNDLAGLTGTGRRFISELESGKETAQLGKVMLVLSRLGVWLNAGYKWD